MLTASLIDAATRSISNGGPLCALLDGFNEDPAKGALALRIAGALHYLHITNRSGGLSSHYEALFAGRPRNGARRSRRSVIGESDIFQRFIANPPQTNEINRVAALLPAFSEVSKRFGLPLDLYELGASGGYCWRRTLAKSIMAVSSGGGRRPVKIRLARRSTIIS